MSRCSTRRNGSGARVRNNQDGLVFETCRPKLSYLIPVFVLAIRVAVAIAAGTTSALAAMNAAPSPRAPNIILILVDDLGYGDLGFTGASDFTTPHIDALASGGVVFRNGYASHSFCAPTRAGLMTGRYQHRFGFQENPGERFPDLGLPESEVTLPELLRGAGYTSALVGKWHLGGAAVFHPLNHGFDEFHGFIGGGHDYFETSPEATSPHSYMQKLESFGERVDFEGYLTDQLTSYATDFIVRNRDEPFFLFLSYNAPHAPLQAPKTYLQRVARIEDKDRRTYAAMVTAVDDGVGRIVTTLQGQGLTGETLIFYMSDNGGAPFSWPSNAPFRGTKGTLLEGGIHVPYIMSWKGHLAPGVYDKPVISFDIFATAAALAGVTLPQDRVIDSVDLLSLLGADTGSPADADRHLFWKQADYQWAVRVAAYKALYVKGDGIYLFQPDTDLGETKDVSHAAPEEAARLQRRFQAWDTELPVATYQSTGIASEVQEKALRDMQETRQKDGQ